MGEIWVYPNFMGILGWVMDFWVPKPNSKPKMPKFYSYPTQKPNFFEYKVWDGLKKETLSSLKVG